jgi:hypothetical protein
MSHSLVEPSTWSEADDWEDRKMKNSVPKFLSGYDPK